MNRLLISLVALVALFANIGCSVEGNPSGGDDAVGAVQANLTDSIPSGPVDVIASVMISCATPGGCDGQAPVVAATAAGDTSLTFPEMNLGTYVLSIPGAPMGELLPAVYAPPGLPPAVPPGSPPYCVYHGTRTDLVGCSFTSYSPMAIPVLAGTTSNVTLVFTFHFSDGDERTLYTSGDIVVTLQADDEQVCGVSTDPCPMGQLCARIDSTAPPPPPTPIPNEDLACYGVCYVPDPTTPTPIPGGGGPWGTPITAPCPYPNSCVHVAGLGFTGMFALGLCVPPAPPAP